LYPAGKSGESRCREILRRSHGQLGSNGVKPGDIHWVELPPAGGREQAGRRPAVVIQDDDFAGALPLVLVIPLTEATSASRFAGTMLVEPTSANGLRQTSVALIFQLGAVDRRRVRNKIGALDADTLMAFFGVLDKLMGRSRP
jgi:mRNA interferase MazF